MNSDGGLEGVIESMWEAPDRELKWKARELVMAVCDSAEWEGLPCFHFSTVTDADEIEMNDHVELNLAVCYCYGFDVSKGKIYLSFIARVWHCCS